MNINKNLFKKSFPFICSECKKFAYNSPEYCESCGSQNTIKKAEKNDYKKYFNSK